MMEAAQRATVLLAPRHQDLLIAAKNRALAPAIGREFSDQNFGTFVDTD
jgi:hypothetical protein